MKKFILSCLILVLIAAAVAVGAGLRSKGAKIERYIQQNDQIIVAEQFDKPIEFAFLICEYAEASQYQEFGFNPNDFYSINNNSHRWETYTGMAVIFDDAETEVLYFDPTRVNACVKVPHARP